MASAKKLPAAPVGCEAAIAPDAASVAPRAEEPGEAVVAAGDKPIPTASAPWEPDRESLAADAVLVAGCIAGEVAAWEEFFSQYRGPLLAAIRAMLPASRRDPHQVEEIAASVWYALVEDDGRLLRKYDARRGARLVTFLRAIGRDFVARHVRSEQRRRGHEAASAAERPTHHAPNPEPEFHEFLASLSPEEREYLGEFLSAEDQEVLGPFCGPSSRTGIWRITRDIKRKFLGYFGRE